MNRLYAAYGEQAEFFLIYIREAHPQGSRRPDRQIRIAEPRTLAERSQVAGTCVADLGLSLPALIDDMADSTEEAYSSWPDRLFLVDRDGTLRWKSGPGPQGFDPAALERELERLFPKR